MATPSMVVSALRSAMLFFSASNTSSLFNRSGGSARLVSSDSTGTGSIMTTHRRPSKLIRHEVVASFATSRQASVKSRDPASVWHPNTAPAAVTAAMAADTVMMRRDRLSLRELRIPSSSSVTLVPV